MNKYNSNYILAPLKPHKPIKNYSGTIWYDADIVREAIISLDYDLLLIDGPPGDTRSGLVKYWDLFKQDIPVIFDDINRRTAYQVMIGISARLKVPCTIYNAHEDKHFGVLNYVCK